MWHVSHPRSGRERRAGRGIRRGLGRCWSSLRCRSSHHSLELFHDLTQLLRRYILCIDDIPNLTQYSQLIMHSGIVRNLVSLRSQCRVEHIEHLLTRGSIRAIYLRIDGFLDTWTV
jgi:hypothetical protein